MRKSQRLAFAALTTDMNAPNDVYALSVHNRFDASIMRATGLVLNEFESEIAANDNKVNELFRKMFILFAASTVNISHVQKLKEYLQNVRRREETIGKQHPALTCPIGGRLIKDPVVAADGHLYERRNIQSWFNSSSPLSATSPVTGKRLRNTDLTENKTIKNGISRMLLRII
jgi:hypothetical protein